MKQFDKGWYIIYTKPRFENKLAEELRKMEIEAFVPVVNQKRKWHDRMKMVECVLFPSYVFVRLENASQLLNSSRVIGFVTYVKFGKLIARVRDNVIANVKMILKEAEGVRVSYQPFFSGVKVVILTGEFSGLECEIIDFEGEEKVLVRIDILNTSLLMNMPSDSLSVA